MPSCRDGVASPAGTQPLTAAATASAHPACLILNGPNHERRQQTTLARLDRAVPCGRDSLEAPEREGNRVRAAAYLDARAVMQHLDSVFGVGGWKDGYQLVNGGSVVCTLSVEVDGECVKKTAVGSPSEQPDDGDKLKAAFSNAGSTPT